MNFIKKLTSFDEFITPSIIKIIYYIFAILIILFGLGEIILGLSLSSGLVIYGLLTITLGPILLKIYFEVLIVIFKIYDKLSIISEQLENKNAIQDDTTL